MNDADVESETRPSHDHGASVLLLPGPGPRSGSAAGPGGDVDPLPQELDLAIIAMTVIVLGFVYSWRGVAPAPPPPLGLGRSGGDGGVPDFTVFEETLFPLWVEQFAVTAEPGQYSLLPTDRPEHNVTSVYGSTDMLLVLHAVGQLAALDNGSVAAWAATVQGFVDRSTGWPVLTAGGWDSLDGVMDPPRSPVPWHAYGQVTEALTLLEALAARPTTLPRVPTTLAAADALVEAGEASWDAQLDQWLGSNQSVLLGAQATGSLVAAAWADLPTSQPANLPVRDAGMAAMAFTDHVVAYLNRTASNVTGLWGTGHRDRTQLLGAAAQLHRIYACFNRTRPHRTVAVDTVLKYQHKVTGVWGVGGTPSRLDYDGLYTATHAAQLVAGDHTTGYRRADIRAACAAYVAAAHRHLSNATAVLGLGTGGYGGSTHSLLGPVFAVAECQHHWPELVTTKRPWNRWECAFAACTVSTAGVTAATGQP